MKTPRKLIGALVVALGLVLIPVASAQAAPFTMSIDNAVLQLGTLSDVRAIDSELDPPDPPATLTGDVTGNTVNVPKDGFVFPPKEAEVQEGMTATINMEANEDITGTFDSATGKLVLNANLKASVEVLGSTCVISPIELMLSSDNADPYLGQAFTDGIEGTGVIGASWTGLPPVTGGGLCSVVAGLIAGPGGIALSHGVHEFQTCETDPGNVRCTDGPDVAPPTAEPKITSSPPATTKTDVASFSFTKGDGETEDVAGFECSLDGSEFENCGSGQSGSKTYTSLDDGEHTFRVKATNSGGAGPAADYSWEIKGDVKPPVGKPRLSRLKVAPKRKNLSRRAARRGRPAKFNVRVRNAGDAAARRVRICVKAPKRLVRVKRCVTKRRVAAGSTVRVRFKVKLKRRALRRGKVKLTFVANGPGLKARRARAVIRVRRGRKKHRRHHRGRHHNRGRHHHRR